MDDVAIRVDDVGKTFHLPIEKNTSIKSLFVNIFKNKKGYELQRALKDISFEVKKGEFFGIVGRNGSGKSTLLKILAGIYQPSKGHVQINGSLVPFIELGVGFNQELTGRENVYLNGALLGFSRKDMEAMYKDIVNFAELERFMDQKLKNYSSGMQVRLAFSIAIRANSDILLLDEVLAVGDENFQKKCIETFRQIKSRGTTVILVSHDMNLVEQFCDQAILINQGENVFFGKSYDAARNYREINRDYTKAIGGLADTKHQRVENAEGQGSVLINTKILSLDGKPISILDSGSSIVVENTITAQEEIINALHSFTLEDLEGKTIAQFSSDEFENKLFDMKKGEKRVIHTTIDNIFPEGFYFVDPDVSTKGREVIYGHVDNAAEFEVRVQRQHPWLLRPSYSMSKNLTAKK